mmetsp:Transcript_67033/g.174497  ORF Transcript_67033/g.174497 Transcript_67033/m.174497 type:complete len:222 (+) Transcript_67033:72-737(+)
MWSLRKINNNFEGGQRGDYIVIGHPEFNLGRVNEHKCAVGFDARPAPNNGPPSAAAERVRRNGGVKALVQGLTEPKPKGSVQARALERRRPPPSPPPRPDQDFDTFLRTLADAAAVPRCSAPHTTVGVGNHMQSGGIYQFNAGANEAIQEVARRLRTDPAAAKRDLLASGSWRYYGGLLERAQRGECANARLAASRSRSLPHLPDVRLPKPQPPQGHDGWL